MIRSELYDKIRELNAASAIKDEFGDNYTRIPNVALEEFLKGFRRKTKTATSSKKAVPSGSYEKALIKLVSTLQYKNVLTYKEAEEVLSAL